MVKIDFQIIKNKIIDLLQILKDKTSYCFERCKNTDIHLIRKICFVFAFIIVILFPLIAINIKFEPLMGVENKVELAEFNFKNIFDNTYQNSVDDYIDQNLNIKPFIVRNRNQFLYDSFNISPHLAIAMNEDKNLISKEVLNYYLHGQYFMSELDIKNQANKFRKLNKALKEKNKNMLVIITPTKARYLSYDEYPKTDKIILNSRKYRYDLPYDRFVSELKKDDLLLFDSIEYIDNNKNFYLEDASPLFYDTGHHWSYYKGRNVGAAIIDYISDNTDISFPKLKIIASKSNVATYPDNDLYELLNLNKKEKKLYMNTYVEYLDPRSSFPSVIISGGSFLGELLFPFATYGLEDNKVFHIENKMYYMNHYEDLVNFEKYDEIPLKDELKNIDLFVFEINEVNIYNASFGFIDYLLEHLDYLEE